MGNDRFDAPDEEYASKLTGQPVPAAEPKGRPLIEVLAEDPVTEIGTALAELRHLVMQYTGHDLEGLIVSKEVVMWLSSALQARERYAMPEPEGDGVTITTLDRLPLWTMSSLQKSIEPEVTKRVQAQLVRALQEERSKGMTGAVAAARSAPPPDIHIGPNGMPMTVDEVRAQMGLPPLELGKKR